MYIASVTASSWFVCWQVRYKIVFWFCNLFVASSSVPETYLHINMNLNSYQVKANNRVTTVGSYFQGTTYLFFFICLQSICKIFLLQFSDFCVNIHMLQILQPSRCQPYCNQFLHAYHELKWTWVTRQFYISFCSFFLWYMNVNSGFFQ